MPTKESIALKKQVLSRLEQIFGKPTKLSPRPLILKYGEKRVYVRVITPKASKKFWFDVTPRLYENHETDFMVYACGNTQDLYVFPIDDFAEFIKKASKGGVGYKPNFTIYLRSHEFEPAGQSSNRFKIEQFFKRFDLIKHSLARTESSEDSKISIEPNTIIIDQEMALRKLREQNLIIRNPTLANNVKVLHKFRCQLCGETIQISKDRFYAETHHIKPLGQPYNGPDKLSNMLCVCPNCHVKLDYRMIMLNLRQLQTIDEHHISEEFVNYHNAMVTNH
jgi:hypothetical protein